MSSRFRGSAPLRPRLAFLAVLLALSPAVSAQQPVRVGSEFQVNVYTNDQQFHNHQRGPSVAMEADGDFVVTWTSQGQDGGEDFGIFARRFSSAGAVLVDEFQVNAYTESAQYLPAVAADAEGDFVIVWQSYQESPQGYGIFARRFTSSGGALLSGDLHVNTFTAGLQGRPAVANESNGDFVVVWQSIDQDGSVNGIFGRLFTSTGSQLDSEFQVNTQTEGNQARPAVAADADGDFVVVWQSYVAGSNHDIFGQRFSSSGTPAASEFLVNLHTASGQVYPSIAAEPDGDFVVAWDSGGQDGNQQGVFARRFSSAGAPLGSEIQVNVHTTEDQRLAAISVEPDGDFVVAWESFGQDGAQEGVFGRRFSSSGTATTAEFQVNTHTPYYQFAAAVGVDADGDFVVAWESYGQDDPTGTGIFAQRFGGPITLDIDGNGPAGALTDGLLALRYFFTLRGTSLTAGAVGAGCTRCDAAAIEPYIAALGLVLDVDGNGSTQPLADGLLIVRYLFGLRDGALTSGAVGAGCTRCDAPSIESYLAGIAS